MKYTSQTPVKRMKKRSEFVALNDIKNNAVPCRAFIFLHALNTSGEVKVGFTASKRVGNAVKRSRAKRRLRAVVDDVMRLNPNFKCSGGAFVLIARHYVFDSDFEKMKKDLVKALEKSGVNMANEAA